MSLFKPKLAPLDTTKALLTIYKDLAQPGVRQVGLALQRTLEFVLFPVADLPAHLVAKARLRLAKSLEDYRDRMSLVDPAEVEPVPSEVGVPIVQKLAYVEDPDVRGMFLNLLTNASTKQGSYLAHPSFITVVSNISSDEAKILVHLRDNPDIPYVIIRLQFNQNEVYDRTPVLTDLGTRLELHFPGNAPIYVENLAGLGVLSRELVPLSDEERHYKPLYRIWEYLRREVEQAGHGGKSFPAVYLKGFFRRTHYGKMLIRACIGDSAIASP